MGNVCPNCELEAPAGFRFCGHCGGQLTAPAPLPSTSRAERRRLTVLFSDLVDSTELSERLDPEEFRDVVRGYQAACEGVIEGLGGHVAQHLGDGLIVYFGYPAATEDDAERAVRAGLGVVEAIGDLSRRLMADRGIGLQVRVGIHTGEVITGEVGTGARREQLALGRAPNLAARLQGLAKPNSVLLSEDVYRLAGGFFVCESLGEVELKGFAERIEVYRVLRSRGLKSRFEVAVREGLSPVVGRSTEFQKLMDRFNRARGGERTAMMVVGEAGIGKSRLIEAFREATASEDRDWLVGRCSPFYANSPLNPIVDLLLGATGIRAADRDERKLRKLERLVAALDVPSWEAVPLLADLLSVPTLGRYSPLGLSPGRHKQRLLETLVELVVRRSALRPLVIVIEDIHWADPSTLDGLALLLDSSPRARLLTIFSFRPVVEPFAKRKRAVPRLTLDGLTDADARTLIGEVAGDRSVPEEIVRHIISKTDGVPIFIEELTKMVLESGLTVSGDGEGRVPSIPETLHASLVARLDRLGPAKDTALLGAVLGREFRFELLAAVSDVDPDELRRQLQKLVDAELLWARGAPGKARYIFKHALIQDAAYGMLLKATRQGYHARIADTLAAEFPDTVERYPEVVAHHFTEANLPWQAARYWSLAATRDRKGFANVEAIGHAKRGLEQLADVASSPERDAEEMTLQSTLGTGLMATEGFGAADVQIAYSRAVDLGANLRDDSRLFVTMAGLWTFHVVRAEYRTALDLGVRLVELAESLGRPSPLIVAHYSVGFTRFYMGEWAAAQSHLDRALAVEVGDHDVTEASPNRDDPRVHVRSVLAHVLWHRGLGDQALEQSRRALELAERSRHPFGRAFALVNTAWLYQFRDEPDVAATFAADGLSIAEEKGFSYWRAHAHFLLAWCRAETHRSDPEVAVEAIGAMRRMLAASRSSGAHMGDTLWLVKLTSAYLRAGMVDEAAATLDEAFAASGATGERSWDPECHRLRGELAVVRHGPGGPEPAAAFQRAIAVAREHGALALELRAALGLGRHWRDVGRPDEAQELVSAVFGRFTEDLDAPDLRAARLLLDAQGVPR